MYEMLYWKQHPGCISARLDKQHEIHITKLSRHTVSACRRYKTSVVDTASGKAIVSAVILDRRNEGLPFVKTAAPEALRKMADNVGLPDIEKILTKRIPDKRTSTQSITLKQALLLTNLWHTPDAIVKLSGCRNDGQDAAVLSVAKIKRALDVKRVKITRIRPWLSWEGEYDGVWLECCCMPDIPSGR